MWKFTWTLVLILRTFREYIQRIIEDTCVICKIFDISDHCEPQNYNHSDLVVKSECSSKRKNFINGKTPKILALTSKNELNKLFVYYGRSEFERRKKKAWNIFENPHCWRKRWTPHETRDLQGLVWESTLQAKSGSPTQERQEDTHTQNAELLVIDRNI